MEPDGDFIVVWQSYQPDDSSYDLFARRFDSAREALAAELQINSQTIGRQYSPAVAAWKAASSRRLERKNQVSCSDRRSTLRRCRRTRRSSFISLSPPRKTPFFLTSPRATTAGSSWCGTTHHKQAFAKLSDPRTAVRRLRHRTGQHLPGQHRVRRCIGAGRNRDGTRQRFPSWSRHGLPGVRRRFGSDPRLRLDGNALSSEFQVNTHTGALDRPPAITGMAPVTSWSHGTATSGTATSSKPPTMRFLTSRFASSLAVLDVDGDGDGATLTDSILIYAIGSVSPTRRSSRELNVQGVHPLRRACHRHLHRLDRFAQLDVDGDGSIPISSPTGF